MLAISTFCSLSAAADLIGSDLIIYENNWLWGLADVNKPMPAYDTVPHHVMELGRRRARASPREGGDFLKKGATVLD